MADNSKILSATSYADFQIRLKESCCSLCPSLCEQRHNIVVDRGNPSAKIVIIGEAPGENEDLQGQAFVGRAGKLLDTILASIGLDSNKDTLIINVVKCRPPDNRKPSQQEAVNCRPYLEWQLKSIQPEVILLLGATAAQHLIPKEKKTAMKNQVGQLFSLEAYPFAKVQVLYHPAYLLRDPRKKNDMWEHIQPLRALLLEKGFRLGPALAKIE